LGDGDERFHGFLPVHGGRRTPPYRPVVVGPAAP
jgi:hypothetical protein